MVKIHGRSIDAIQFSGEIEEIIDCLEPMKIQFDDGTVIKVELMVKSSIWAIKVLKKGEGFHRLEPARKKDVNSMVLFVDCFDYQVI